MKLEITVSFGAKWILDHRTDATLPVDNVITLVNDLFKDAKVLGSSFATTSFVLETDLESVALAQAIKDGVQAMYTESYAESGINVESRSLTDEEYSELLSEATTDSEVRSDAAAADEASDIEKSRSAEELRAAMQRRFEEISERKRQEADGAEERNAVSDNRKSAVAERLAEVDRLPGSSEFKALCHELADVAPILLANKTVDAFDSRSYLFVINDGCGLDDDLDLFANIINTTGLKKLASRSVVECTLGPVKESEEPFENANRMLRMSEINASPQIMKIDISEWLNATDNRYFKNFLKQLSKQKSYIPVFRVPYVDKFVQDRIYKALNDVMFVKRIVVPPYTHKELADFAKRTFASYGYTLNKAAWRNFFARLDDERADGRFYGLDTVRKVVMELLYDKQVYDAKSGAKNKNAKTAKTIDGKAAANICAGVDTGEYGMEALKKLVGSAEIEKRVNEIIAQIELSLKAGKERPCIHMQFVGNPGTGKTTVARIVGKILKERGILSVGNFFEHSGRDFCGRYIGETAPKTSGMCRDAYGSVMFIDEAYSLYRGDGNDRDFGREALDTLIAEMENHRSDFVVIMAGYTEDMKKMMEGNSGLRSRVPYTIEFPNFTREQLHEIFVAMVGKLACEPTVLDKAKKYFDELPAAVLESKEFSNARFVRNLFERTWAKASMRCQLAGEDIVGLVVDDFDRAIADGEFKFDNDSKQARIGFRV